MRGGGLDPGAYLSAPFPGHAPLTPCHLGVGCRVLSTGVILLPDQRTREDA
ncbi:hypothetical protein C882_4289 [Caenispirillum salinarum AK4]|uniref:Uncharacterized protein n=1 Tax=Caenispirillum salinarum AK4 TaxID=1238182 RepID=K9H078_9PROT|nr:hypothetical protein C882_4289 [Caenispirillum salinarum AK4]